MKRIVVAVMAAGLIVLPACSNKLEQKNDTGQKVDAEISKTTESEVIRTENELQSLLKSIKPGEVKKSVALVGVLNVGSAPSLIGAPSSKLTIGNTSVFVRMDQSDKDEFSRKTVSMKADISIVDPKLDANFQEPVIENVQDIEIVKEP